MEKMKEDEFFFPEQMLIDALGKEEVERLKKEEPEIYKSFRNSPLFMPSDVIYDTKASREKIYNS